MIKKIFKLLLLLGFAVFMIFSLIKIFSDSEAATKKIQDVISKEKYAQLNQEYLIAIQEGNIGFLNNYTDAEYINVENDLFSKKIVELTDTVDINSFTPYNLQSHYNSEAKYVELISEYSSTGNAPYTRLTTTFKESGSELKIIGISLVPQEKSLINTSPIIKQHDNPIMIYIIFALGIISLIFASIVFVKNRNISIWWLLFIILGNLFIFSVRSDQVLSVGIKFGIFVPQSNSQFYFIAPIGVIIYLINFFKQKEKNKLSSSKGLVDGE